MFVLHFRFVRLLYIFMNYSEILTYFEAFHDCMFYSNPALRLNTNVVTCTDASKNFHAFQETKRQAAKREQQGENKGSHLRGNSSAFPQLARRCFYKSRLNLAPQQLSS